MHGKVDMTIEQRLIDLLGEQALAANLGEAPVLHPVAGRADRDNLDGTRCGEIGVRGNQAVAHESGLVKRHRAAAGADAER